MHNMSTFMANSLRDDCYCVINYQTSEGRLPYVTELYCLYSAIIGLVRKADAESCSSRICNIAEHINQIVSHELCKHYIDIITTRIHETFK
jgi:hypothetical protein